MNYENQGENKFVDSRPDYEVNANDRRSNGTAQALDELESAIVKLDEELGRMYQTLDPLLVPEHESRSSDPGDAMPQVSPVAERIYRLNYKLKQMGYALRTLRERVDI